MKTNFLFYFFFILFQCSHAEYSIAVAGGLEIYSALQSNDTSVIRTQLDALDKSSLKEKDAYTGALMMKMSGLLKSGMEKLSVFKKGRVKLEQSIKIDSLNVEYRFLRLLIQENVPDFLNYHSKKVEDAGMIKASFSKLNPDLQETIINYSKNSKLLKPEDLHK